MKTKNDTSIITSPTTIKLHLSKTDAIIKWLNDNNKTFMEYRDTVTIYCIDYKERKEILKACSE